MALSVADFEIETAMNIVPTSSKLSAASRKENPYPYYAGFSEDFVANTLQAVNARPGDIVLDPWNGAGTTTTVASHLGIDAIGIDLNPVMFLAAKIRAFDRQKLRAYCNAVLSQLHRYRDVEGEFCPFQASGEAFGRIRNGFDRNGQDVLLFGLMLSCKRASSGSRSQNPTWFSRRRLETLRLHKDEIESLWVSSFETLREWSQPPTCSTNPKSPKLVTGDWLRCRNPNRVTHIITSPPYLTRIDYPMKTLPELLLLSEVSQIDIDSLRRNMLGTVLTERRLASVSSDKIPYVSKLLTEIREHESKASRTYYFHFFRQYFDRLFRSLSKINKIVDSPRTITLVSQGSFYKDLFIDLPKIIDEMMHHFCYKTSHRHNFVSRHNIVAVNTRAYASSNFYPDEISATYSR